MLSGTIIFLLWEKIITDQNKQRIIFKSILIGVIIFVAIFFKENALIFIPFLFCAAFLNKTNNSLKAGLIGILTFCFLIFLSGCMYYYFTSNFFFRIAQMQTANYPNPCNYNILAKRELIIRLTYGVWREFIVESFYPVIFAATAIVLKILFDKKYKIKRNQWSLYFIILLILGLYFPFSLNGYQPLCFKARHFLFLLPLGVTVSTCFLQDLWNNKRSMWLFIIASAILFAVCIISTGEKWYWMMYGFLMIYFLFQKFIPDGSFLYKWKYAVFGMILWVYMPYHLFFGNSNWFNDMQALSKKLNGNFFYFPDHDNMMHWELLHHFENSFHSYSLEKEPFKVFEPYYEKLDIFHPGWIIVNKKYTTRSLEFSNKMDSLGRAGYFSKQISTQNISASFINDSSQFSYVKKISDEN